MNDCLPGPSAAATVVWWQIVTRKVLTTTDASSDGFLELGIFGGLVRATLGRLVAATRRTPEPVRRILWGVRADGRDGAG
jgi:hypothetical protein